MALYLLTRKEGESGSRDCYVVELVHETVCVDGRVEHRKQISLPFVPFTGLVIDDVDGAREDWTISEVLWSYPEKRFICWTKTSGPFLALTVAECRKDFKEHGWSA